LEAPDTPRGGLRRRPRRRQDLRDQGSVRDPGKPAIGRRCRRGDRTVRSAPALDRTQRGRSTYRPHARLDRRGRSFRRPRGSSRFGSGAVHVDPEGDARRVPRLDDPEGATPKEVYDVTALSSPTELPPSEPIEQQLDGPVFGTEPPPPRSAIAAVASAAPWWLLVPLGALVAVGLVLIGRRRRSRAQARQASTT
jgi:hypothetical protein